MRHPPYLPGGESLEARSLRADSRHCVDANLLSPEARASLKEKRAGGGRSNGLSGECVDVTHYDTHNLYGLAEARVTALALDDLRPRSRSLVISRSTFPGSGAWGGHWLGDNEASWADLRASIPGMLTLGLSGVALVGADLCGFAGPASRELCIRWTELGALYPFSRNHNTLDTPAQHPSAWDPQVRPRACQHAATQKQAHPRRRVGCAHTRTHTCTHPGTPTHTHHVHVQAQEWMRAALERRYRLLPYLYTVFHHASVSGVPVARSLIMEFASLYGPQSSDASGRAEGRFQVQTPETSAAERADGLSEARHASEDLSTDDPRHDANEDGGDLDEGKRSQRRREILEALSTDAQYMLGPALMVTPVLQPGADNVSAVFPAHTKWYRMALRDSHAPWHTRAPRLRTLRCAPTQVRLGQRRAAGAALASDGHGFARKPAPDQGHGCSAPRNLPRVGAGWTGLGRAEARADLA